MALAAIFQIGSLGDTIVSVPSLRSLRDLLPDCSDYLLISHSESKFNVQPNHIFDMVWKAKHELRYAMPKTNLSGRSLAGLVSLGALLAKLHYYRPKYCVYLMPADRAPRQVDRDIRFFRACRVPNLIGFRAVTEADRTAAPGASVRTTEAYLRFRRLWNERSDTKFSRYGQAPLLEPGAAARAAVARWLAGHRVAPARRLVALCPYSNYPSRNIPHATLVELLARLDSELGVETVLLGGSKDTADADRLISEARNGLNACGVFSPEESAALLGECSLAICTESGPMHLAGALAVPTVVTFSRINKVLHSWFPLGANHTILYQDVPCAGCCETVCPIPGHPCMQRTTAGQILSAAAAKLGRSASAPEAFHGTHTLEWPEPHLPVSHAAPDESTHAIR
jgi:heptosyltransferase III